MADKPDETSNNVLPAKHWSSSRTIWVNAIASGLVALEANTHVLQPLLPVNVYAVLAVGLPVINMFLRALTTQPITMESSIGSTP